VRRQPSSFEVSLALEPGNRYFPQAIAVLAGDEKIGYLAPEVARQYFDRLRASGPVTCPARRAAPSDHDSSGVEILLDFSAL
jgi:hypothetical protein